MSDDTPPREGIVVLEADGLRAAAAMQRERGDCTVWLFDPTLMDRAAEAGIVDPQLHAWTGSTSYAEIVRWSHDEAFAIERRLDRAFAEIHPGASFVGWQHLHLYYLLMQLRWYSEMWTACAPLMDGHTVHVYVSDNPAQYYWPSFVPALLLLQQLIARGTPVKAYTFARREDLSQRVPDLRGRSSGPTELLTHLPTCFHDATWIRQELAATGLRSVNLQARHWNVDFEAQRQIGLIDSADLALELDDTQRARADAFVSHVQQLLQEVVLPRWLSSPPYRERQARHMAEAVRAQLFLYESLGRHFGNQPPARLLISEHDTGFHGPLLSYAARERAPVVVIPHSRTVTDFEFPPHAMTALTHPLQATAPLDPEGRRIHHAAMSYPESFSAGSHRTEPIRRVGLMLNGLTIACVLCTPWDDYVAGIRRIADWCRERGLALQVRSRPGQTMTAMLGDAAGLSPAEVHTAMAGTLETFAQQVDVCLMYDAPTNGAIEFLKRGIPLLNPVVDTLARNEALTCNADVVPREDVASTLARLDAFLSDGAEWHLFASRQFARYVALFDGCLPLRHFLRG
jgi:hypothetical protein